MKISSYTIANSPVLTEQQPSFSFVPVEAMTPPNGMAASNASYASPISSSSTAHSIFSSPKRKVPDTPFAKSSIKKSRVTAFQQAAHQAREIPVVKKQGRDFERSFYEETDGAHCVIAFFKPEQPAFIEDIDNDSLILKFYKEETLIKEGLALENVTIPLIQAQYKELQSYAATYPADSLPYAVVYNIDTIVNDGYIVQERVIPFPSDNLPWNANTKIETLSETNKGYLEQIKKLFHYSFMNLQPGLDLQWSNLGVRKGQNTLVLFDFYELDDPFYLNAEQFLQNLSCGNLEIQKMIVDGLGEKCASIFITQDTSIFDDGYDFPIWVAKDHQESKSLEEMKNLLVAKSADLLSYWS